MEKNKVREHTTEERMWRLPNDSVGKVSRELALDLGWADWERYESWPKYPDDRDLPVGVEARARWDVRKVELLSGKSVRKFGCSKCGEVHLTVADRWCDAESREADLLRMAELNGMTVADVRKRLGVATKVISGQISVTKLPETFDVCQRPGCGNPIEFNGTGRPPKFCSDACRKKLARSKG